MTEDERARNRANSGPRAKGQNEHYALCNGLSCPCYQEGREDAASTELAGCDAYTGCQAVCNCTEEP